MNWAGADLFFRSTPRVAGPLLSVISVWLLLSQWGTTLHLYFSRSRENLRAVVEMVRSRPEALMPPGPKDALLGTYWSAVSVYDRSAVVLRNSEDLETLVAKARRKERPLYVECAWRAFADKGFVNPVEALLDTGRFERVAAFPGLDDVDNAHVIWKLKPSP